MKMTESHKITQAIL